LEIPLTAFQHNKKNAHHEITCNQDYSDAVPSVKPARALEQTFRIAENLCATQLACDVGGHLTSGLVPRVGIASHGFLADRAQWTRHASSARGQLSRRRFGQHEPQDCTQRENVGSVV
jgi:hypothetical protein